MERRDEAELRNTPNVLDASDGECTGSFGTRGKGNVGESLVAVGCLILSQRTERCAKLSLRCMADAGHL